jgi:hypothetical protein
MILKSNKALTVQKYEDGWYWHCSLGTPYGPFDTELEAHQSLELYYL